MMRRANRWCGLIVGTLVVLTASPAVAQVIATVGWQLQPYCNVVTLTVSVAGPTFTTLGTDDQCGGGGPKAGVVGMAFLNPDGSIGIGLTSVLAPGGTAVHTDAAISLATLNGTWRDSAGNAGTFAFAPGGGTGGPLRPVPLSGLSPGSVTSTQLAPGSVGPSQLAPGSVGPSQLAAGAVNSSTQISPNTIALSNLRQLPLGTAGFASVTVPAQGCTMQPFDFPPANTSVEPGDLILTTLGAGTPAGIYTVPTIAGVADHAQIMFCNSTVGAITSQLDVRLTRLLR